LYFNTLGKGPVDKMKRKMKALDKLVRGVTVGIVKNVYRVSGPVY
jgi:hypothetical protein